MLPLRITPGSPAPIYQQITTQLRHAIATGALAPGDLVPSVRTLASQLLINPNTVAKAYADLSHDGLLDTLPGKGLAVANHHPNLGLSKTQRLRRLEPALSQLLHEAIALNINPEDLHDLLDKKWKALTLNANP